MKVFLLIAVMLLFGCSTRPAKVSERNSLPPKTYYRYSEIFGNKIFYREAGDRKKKTIVLLHGYPSSSHTYREIIPLLSRYFHVIAPDNLGSGFSDHPDPARFLYTFDKLADHVQGLLAQLKIEKYILYMQDFGAPVGFRLMMRNPENVLGIVSQNANAYLDGLTNKRQEFFHKAHHDRSRKHVENLFKWTSEDAVINGQYLRDVPVDMRETMSPDSWTHDLSFLRTTKDRQIQVQLFQNYQSNIEQYSEWQAVMREKQFPALIVWGKKDAAFISAGAEAFLKDLPDARLHLLDAGHFAVEEKSSEIAVLVLDFMESIP